MGWRWNEQVAGPGFPPGRDLDLLMVGERLTGDGLRRAHKWLNVAGVIALVAGVVAVVVPIVASVAIAIFVGWVLLAAGTAIAVQAIPHRSLLKGVEAVLTLIAGLYLLLAPLSGTVTLAFVLAVWFFASGIVSLIAAAQLRGVPGAWATGVGGLLSVVLGVLIAVSLPSSASWAVGLLVGVNLIFWGLRALIGASLLRRLLGG